MGTTRGEYGKEEKLYVQNANSKAWREETIWETRTPIGS